MGHASGEGCGGEVVFARTKMHFSLTVPPPDECCLGENVMVVCFPLDRPEPESAAVAAAMKNQNYQSSLS